MSISTRPPTDEERTKLSDTAAKSAVLPAGKVDHDLWDAELPGFGLRLRPGGKTWFVAYRPVGFGRSASRKRMKIGDARTLSATDARKLARATLGRIAAGADPLTERRQQRLRDKARLSDVIDRYEADLKRREYVNAKVVAAGFRTKMKAMLSRDIATITGAELARLIEEMETAGRAGAAKNFRTLARAFFGWAVTKARVLEINPLAGYRKERATRADRVAKAEHGRALSDAELLKVWQSADQDTAFGRLLRFWILTGCRRGEGAGLTWAMVDRKRQVLDLPAVFTKQGRGHLVPITPALGVLLDGCRRDTRSDLVFPSGRSGRTVSGWTKFVRQANAAAGVEFQLHDLRRTFRTGLSRLGVPAEYAELALGHARSDLEAVYNRDGALERLRHVFAQWSEHVTAAVSRERQRGTMFE